MDAIHTTEQHFYHNTPFTSPSLFALYKSCMSSKAKFYDLYPFYLAYFYTKYLTLQEHSVSLSFQEYQELAFSILLV